MGKKKLNRRDILLIVLALVIGFTVNTLVQKNQQKGYEVAVSVDGKETRRFSLAEDAEYTITGYKGKGRNQLIIANQQARIQEADCPDLVCANHKPIYKKGETIICMPHRVIVQIVE